MSQSNFRERVLASEEVMPVEKEISKVGRSSSEGFATESDESHTPSVWEGRLHHLARNPVQTSVEDALPKSGDM